MVGFFVNAHLELNYGEDINFVGNDILHPVNTAMVIARILGDHALGPTSAVEVIVATA